MRKTVCFFGHHDAPDDIQDKLQHEIRSLIINENAQKFYVGNHGRFDYMVLKVLREIKAEYPNIDYSVVLAYMPDRPADEHAFIKTEETVFPDGLENVPKRFGILWRNDWMLKQSDTVICYVWNNFGGAAKMLEKANKNNKQVINLAK